MEVEWLLLADAAEVVNNKLYLLGGGWEAISVGANLPTQHACALAAAISVPWEETNQRQRVELLVVDQDETELVKIEAQVEVGRPAGIAFGQPQRVQLAVGLTLPLRRYGEHTVIARIEGEEARRTRFAVLPDPRARPAPG